jgi:hypothetical protein
MASDSKSITYFPWTELTLFVISTSLTLSVTDNFKLGIWLRVFLAFFSYLIFLGGTNRIRLTKDKLHIIFLNCFGGHISINLKSITKIWTEQSYQQESTTYLHSTYNVFRRYYHIEYTDNKGKKRLTHFKINSGRKEIAIMNWIKESQTNDK